jgi:hypothetical protein
VKDRCAGLAIWLAKACCLSDWDIYVLALIQQALPQRFAEFFVKKAPGNRGFARFLLYQFVVITRLQFGIKGYWIRKRGCFNFHRIHFHSNGLRITHKR